ncbi:hypothetical protein OAK35_01870 [Crocinitomicaceae bacterium]|nr:hypothetical protein [Crocinitomicaceae bacterium]
MLTSIEIARLLKKQQKRKEQKQGFDTALLGLGIALKNNKKKPKYFK